ncbi:hypothetical protein L7F22_006723 [Adiantum nelumboides]|nr:hypothetical protein [Adiantum nelumboides]
MEFPRAELDEYQKFVWRMNPPRVDVDNSSCEVATLFKVDSSNRHGILLEVVQALTDLDLRINKAYISSDGGWFMNVFYVTDAFGNKISDEVILGTIEKRISSCHEFSRRIGLVHSATTSDAPKLTIIELTGRDRPGLMSEICALLTQMKCNVNAAELWTHNMRVACLLHVSDEATGGLIEEKDKLHRIKESLCNVLKGDQDSKGARMDFVTGITHSERRLHQMMFADRDYEREDEDMDWDSNGKITVDNCDEKGYSVLHIECRNRPKLVFDTLCTLTDMHYVVFHATIDSDGQRAYQEYYIRHTDGCILNSEAERRRVIQCLRAAIERRVFEGLRLELCTSDRVGLLSEVTRIMREHGLSVTRADVSTTGNNVTNVFYVTDTAGNEVDLKVVEAVRREIGQAVLKVTPMLQTSSLKVTEETKSKFSFGTLFGMPSQMLHNLGLIRSHS